MKKTGIFHTLILPLFVMVLWGSLYPMIKVGYYAFGVDTSSVADILMFAAVRFILSGLIVCIIALFKKEKINAPKTKNILMIVLIGIIAIFLHYAFIYVGLTSTDSSKSALIKQAGTLLYVCSAFLFIKEEKFNKFKIIGGIIGFIGIITINWTGKSFYFSAGDILVILASICTVVSSILSKVSAKDCSAYWMTGISQLAGGVFLFITASIMGGTFPTFTLSATLVFIYICAASVVGYLIWYYTMKTVTVSRLFIIKFAEPLLACIFSAIMLGENIFKIQYLIAFILISLGITLGNRN